jgi:membrane protease YdiL (CAAX protease family)
MVEMAGLLLLTGTGGVLFAWLAYRWQSLWFPISVHILTNLWWAVFSVSDTALAGWFAFALQLTSIVTAIAITLRWSRRSVQDKSGIEALEPGF